MTTSPVVEVRAALMAALAARAELAGVQVSYAHPGQAVRAESIWSQNGTGDLEYAAYRAGRKTRNEETTFEVVVSVLGPGDDQLTTDRRALELGESLEDYIADDPGAFAATGAYTATVTGMRLTGGLTEAGRVAEVTYTVSYRARLT